MTALMSRRASDRVRVGTCWNSPSFSSVVASSSPPAFSRAREVGVVNCAIFVEVGDDLGGSLRVVGLDGRIKDGGEG